MARNESTVIQGTLITCIILLVLSLAGNFFFWQASDTASTEMAAAKDQLNNAQNQIRQQSNQLDRLKSMIGFGQMTQADIEALKNSVSDDPEMAEIEKAFVQDMTLLPPDVEPQNRNYRFLPLSLMQALRDRNTELADARAQINDLSAEKDALIKSETEARQAAEAASDELANKLSEEKESYQKDRERMALEKEELRDQLTRTGQMLAAKQQEASQIKAQLEKQVAQNQTVIDQQAEMIDNLQDDEFETAQGKITWVAPERRVYINLGRLDLLRTGIVFGVLDADEIKVSRATPKAQIEVLDILGDHLALAKIVDQKDVGNPVTKNDKIYSPFWEPGQTVKVALAGSFDLDGDGRSDREMVKNMIRRAGAEIVAEVTEDGVRQGDPTFDTRYLVVGDVRQYQGSDDVEQSQQESRYQQTMGKFKADAKSLGVTEISASKLLGYLRSINDEKTVPLGSQARGEDFEPQPVRAGGGQLPSDVSSSYRNSDE